MALFLITFYLYIIASIVGLTAIFIIWRRQKQWEKVNGPLMETATVSREPSRIKRVPFLDINDILREQEETIRPLPIYHPRKVKRSPLWRIAPSDRRGRQKQIINKVQNKHYR